jgi:triosephosphate isomerase
MPQDVEKAIKTIRSQIKYLYGEKAAKEVKVLYGGSVNPDSAADYTATAGVDGLLVGGASLNADQFTQIIEKVYKQIK